MSINGLTFEMDELNPEGKWLYVKFKFCLFFSDVFPHEIILKFFPVLVNFLILHHDECGYYFTNRII